jgi:hypothetical protein
MNDILGLVDSLEATILESPKVPLTDKLVIEEKKILQLVDKVRMAIKNGGIARQSIDINKEIQIQDPVQQVAPQQSETSLSEAQEKARQIKQGANEYAEYVLSNLQLSVSKLQNQLIKLEKNIENGRDVLEKQKSEDATGQSAPAQSESEEFLSEIR